MKLTNAEARIIALEAQLRIYSQPERCDDKLEGDFWNSVGKNQRESYRNLLGCGWQLQGTWLSPRVIKGNKVNMIYVNKDTVSCASVHAEQWSAQKSTAVVNTKKSWTHMKKHVK